MFNKVGNAHMFRPAFPGGPPDMFPCGNDADAKRVVTEILTDFGWPAIGIGGIQGARLLEPLCMLWVGHGIRTGTEIMPSSCSGGSGRNTSQLWQALR